MGSDAEAAFAKDRIYIGESDNVHERLVQHDNKKDFWEEVILFTNKDDNLTKAHVRYLERELIQAARDASRATLDNSQSADYRPLPERDRADMQAFLDQVRLMLPVLGFMFLQPVAVRSHMEASATPAVTNDATSQTSPEFELVRSGVRATAWEAGGDFIVLKGSGARKEDGKGFRSYRNLKHQLISDGKLVADQDGAVYVFAEDVPFRSPSGAASVVCGMNTNGRTSWRIKGSSTTYGDWDEARLRGSEG
ncbi:MAG TPA: GIY-YIG nuclease family protein [Ktedonobacterales bacterium]